MIDHPQKFDRDMSSFESKLEAFLEIYEKLKSVENEEAFLREFIVRECSLKRDR